MYNKFNIIIVLVILIAVIFSAYFVGKKSGEKKITKIVNNQSFIKEIAELSSLEINGTASIKNSNISNDGSIQDALKKFFSESSIEIEIPYKAKYGVTLDSQSVQINQTPENIVILLPQPQLLSFELQLDKINKNIKSGIFSTLDNDDYLKAQTSLYEKTKQILLNDSNYKEKAKEKISNIISEYYAPLNLPVEIIFKDDIQSKVVEKEIQ